MNGSAQKSSVIFVLIWFAAGAIAVGAALETSRYSHYVFAAACLFFGLAAYRRPPFRIFANEPPVARDLRADVTSMVGLLLLVASLVLRYVVPAA